MGKIRTRVLGLEDVEEKQKKEQKAKSEEKKKSRKKEETVVEEKETSSVKSKEKNNEEKKQKTVPVKNRGKNYQKIKKMIDKTKRYSLEEAIALVKQLKTAKFDESVELHINTDAAGLKGELVMPHSIGKTLRVKIVDDKLLEGIEAGKLDFDILVTHPSFMPKLAKYAKVLGPKGLMPNPKAGTISPKPEELVKKFEAGSLRWKTEAKFPLVHQLVGKASFSDQVLIENCKAFFKSIGKAHMKTVFIKLTMSPSIKLNIDSL